MPAAGKPTTLKVISFVSKGKLKRCSLKKLPVDERAYYRDLHYLIDLIYQESNDVHGWDWSQLAYQAGLSPATTERLGKRQTRFPRFMTIYKLAKAVGWKLVLQDKTKKRTSQKAA